MGEKMKIEEIINKWKEKWDILGDTKIWWERLVYESFNEGKKQRSEEIKKIIANTSFSSDKQENIDVRRELLDQIDKLNLSREDRKEDICENCGCKLTSDEEGWCDNCNLPERSIGLI
jgi:hypothetical protein